MNNILITVQLPQVIAQHTLKTITSKRCKDLVPFSIFLALSLEGVEKGIFCYPKSLNLNYAICKSGTKKYLAANQVKKEEKKCFNTSILQQLLDFVKLNFVVPFFNPQTILI